VLTAETPVGTETVTATSEAELEDLGAAETKDEAARTAMME